MAGEPSSPSVSILIRDEIRTKALDAYASNQSGDFSKSSSGAESLKLKDLFKISVQTEDSGALPGGEAKEAVRVAIANWAEALLGLTRFEIVDDPAKADLRVVFRPSVIESMGSMSMVGCFDVRSSQDGAGTDISVSIKQPGGGKRHSAQSLTHNVAKGIGFYLGLEKQKGTDALMGIDTHDAQVPTKPTVVEAGALRGFHAFTKSLRDSSDASKKSDIPMGQLELDETVFDAGEVWRGDLAVGTYKIKNAGKAPLNLRMDASCGCTVPQYPEVLEPGEEGTVKVELDTKGTSGQVAKSVQVLTNGLGASKSSIVIRAKVKPPFDVQPILTGGIPIVQPNQVETLTIKALRDPKGKILEVSIPNKFASAKVVGAEGPVTKVAVTFSPETPFGRTGFSLQVKTDSKTEPTFAIPITVEKGIVSEPSSLWFGNVQPQPAGKTVRAALIRRAGKPFKVLGVKTDDPKLKVWFEPLRPGQEYRVYAEYSGGWPTGSARSKLTISTDDPVQPNLEVSASAFIR